MEDGILYLAARLYAAEAESIIAEYDAKMEAACLQDADTSVILSLARERDIMLAEHQYFNGYLGATVDVVDGVDEIFYEWEVEEWEKSQRDYL